MDKALLEELNTNIKELIKLNKLNQNVFNAREAAEYLRIGYDTLLRLTRIGQIEYVPNGSSYLYKREFLDKWLDKNRKIEQC
ncbi:helix-turn-helix domain-containing protein [Tissierella praeacuta]|uniref:helix-turn-helix domain-containing protein n=1 Tax=Tissierella praeacuta TaxID=43131 RepID=UPI003DA1DEDD